MVDKIPEVNLNMISVEVKGKKPIKLTIRNTFYAKNKIVTVYYYLLHCIKIKRISFKDYLDLPARYKIEFPKDIYL